MYKLEQKIEVLNEQLEASRAENISLEGKLMEVLFQAPDVRPFGTGS